MVIVGLIAFFADLVFWSPWGPGYMRRTYVNQGLATGPGTAPLPPAGAIRAGA